MLLRLRHLTEYAAFRALLALVAVVPPRAAAWLAAGLAWLICGCVPGRLTRSSVVAANLAASFPDLSAGECRRIARAMWTHFLRCVFEAVQFPRRFTLGRFYESIELRGAAPLLDALLSGRPVILAGGHFGNWELAIHLFGRLGFQFGVVHRDLDNPYLQSWCRRFRASTGHELISKDGCLEVLVERLRRGGSVAVMIDQDAGKGGMFVEFLGRPASTLKSIALLALECDAVICVGYALRLDDGPGGNPRYELGIERLLDPRRVVTANPVRELTEGFTSALERVVRRAPEQYFWLHRRWKSLPGQKRRDRRKQPADDERLVMRDAA